MRTTLTCLAFAAITCAIANAQVVQVRPHDGASDMWGRYFNAKKKLTFTGKVTGIGVSRQAPGSDEQIILMIQNRTGGGTAEVQVGPKWFVDQQDAKVKPGDEVQVTGSRVSTTSGGIVVASQIRVHGQGGPVLALRRLSGRAYWLPTEVAVKPFEKNSGSVDDDNSVAELPPVNVTPPNYPPNIIQLDGGVLNIQNGPGFYGVPNMTTPVGRALNIISGAYPFVIYPF